MVPGFIGREMALASRGPILTPLRTSSLDYSSSVTICSWNCGKWVLKTLFPRPSPFLLLPPPSSTCVPQISAVSHSGHSQGLLYKGSQGFTTLSVLTASSWLTPWWFPEAASAYVSNQECSLMVRDESKSPRDPLSFDRCLMTASSGSTSWQTQGHLLLSGFECDGSQGQCLEITCWKSSYRPSVSK